MCTAIEFDAAEFGKNGLIRMSVNDRDPKLGIRTCNGPRYVLWGYSKNFCLKKESLVSGYLCHIQSKPVEIIANRALVNGIWFQIKKGIRGILILDGKGSKRVLILTEPSTHYFKIMTRADRMPVLIDQLI